MWWNDNFLFRREVVLSSIEEIEIGHSVSFSLTSKLVENSKAREDFYDIEVVYEEPEGNFYVLERKVELQEDNSLIVTFDVLNGFYPQAPLGQYHVYYGNPDLIQSPRLHLTFPGEYTFPSGTIFPTASLVQGAYEEDLWPVDVTPDSGLISFTRPGTEWVDGRSSKVNATASLNIRATRFRIVSDTDSSYGKFAVRVDRGEWDVVSLKGEAAEAVSVYEKVLGEETNTSELIDIEIKVAEDDKPVNIKSVEYSRFFFGEALSEEVSEAVTWSTFISGA